MVVNRKCAVQGSALGLADLPKDEQDLLMHLWSVSIVEPARLFTCTQELSETDKTRGASRDDRFKEPLEPADAGEAMLWMCLLEGGSTKVPQLPTLVL